MSAERFATLDATRGAAVMGILLINIISFSMPEQAYISPLAWGGTGPADIAIWVINQLFFEGRMRGLFALLFGASAMLVMARADAKAEGAARVHLSRMAALALFGLAHCYLVWEGDVLFHYAVLGCLLLLVRNWSVKALVRVAIVLLALHTLYWGVQFVGALSFQSIATAPDATAEMVRQYRAMMASFPGPDSPSIAARSRRLSRRLRDVLDYRLRTPRRDLHPDCCSSCAWRDARLYAVRHGADEERAVYRRLGPTRHWRRGADAGCATRYRCPRWPR